VPTLSVAGGIHVRLHPDRPDYILIEFIEKELIRAGKEN